MLDKNERQFFPGQDVQSALGSIQAALYAQGIALQQTGASSWGGRGTLQSYGMVPKIGVSVFAVQGGFFLDVRVSPDFEGNGLILFVVAWLFFFPAAIVLAILAYQDWQNRQLATFHSIWGPLAHRIAAPPPPQWAAGPAAPGPIAPGGWGQPPG